MKKIALALVALVGLVMMDARSVSAGSKFETPTFIQKNADGSGTAHGGLAAARASANAVEFIGCIILGTPGQLTGSCNATDAAGIHLSCFTDDPALVGAIAGMTSEPFLQFNVNNLGRCTLISIETASYDGPKQP